jgi:uncharacterized protein (TIGR00251 family)
VSLRVRVHPRAGRDGLVGVRQGALVVRLAAPPVEGKANAALLRYLAGALELPASAISLQQGQRGRDKLLLVSGVESEVLGARLRRLLDAG